ncbi:MAG: hypothetical protein ACOC0W_02665 [Desulfosalsimonas sp.]
MNDELLQTKIRIPPVQSRVMDRPHLKSRLDDALKSRLVMVSAPAGFGKTTLLANWAAGAPNPPAWLSLDSDDNDSHVFWKYFVAALSGAYPGTGVSAMKTLQSPSGIPVKAVVKTLINEIFQKRETVSIVLDDFHLIESGSVLELFKFFIDYMPENVRLVISTRTDLSFSAGRLRAEGQFDTITGEEL